MAGRTFGLFFSGWVKISDRSKVTWRDQPDKFFLQVAYTAPGKKQWINVNLLPRNDDVYARVRNVAPGIYWASGFVGVDNKVKRPMLLLDTLSAEVDTRDDKPREEFIKEMNKFEEPQKKK